MNSQELCMLGRLKSCKLLSPRQLQEVHAFVIKTSSQRLNLPYSNLVSVSANLTSYVSYILKHSDKPERCLNLCNAIVQSLSSNCKNSNSNGNSLEALSLFREMLANGLVPDNYTVPFVLKACALSRALREGLQIHGFCVKIGLLASNVYVKNTLMRVYAVCGFVDYVQKLFDEGSQRDLVTWTTLIQCYVKMGFPREGVKAFFQMREAQVIVDEMTVVIALSACSKLGDLSLGRKLHRYIRDYGVKLDIFVGNALVDMYLKCGDVDIARGIFDDMPVRNVVSWNSLISGLVYQGNFKEALNMFRKMQRMGLEPDDVTLVGVLNSCANLGMLGLGKWVHGYIDKNQIEADGFIGNALVDMYAKCGNVKQAYRVFQEMKHKDVYSYTAIIVGLAMHGEAKEALVVFSEMPKVGIKPDEVTFIGILAACSHAGLVVEGQKYFTDMLSVYSLKPQMEHYGCMVDLLGRAGLINEAEEFIKSMPIEPDASIWGALLGACRIHGQVKLGESAMKKLLEMEPGREGAYILMSNLYSSTNKWKDAVRLRKSMKVQKLKKTPGCSSIELDGIVYEFQKGDKSHARSKEIHELLEKVTSHIKNYWHLAFTGAIS